MRRIVLIVIGFVIVGILVSVFFALRNEPTSPENGSGVSPGGQIAPGIGAGGTVPGGGGGGGATPPIAGSQKVSIPTQEKVSDYFVDTQDALTFIRPDGQITRVAGGKTFTLSSATIADLERARFSSDGQKILVTFGDRLNPQSSVFDIPTKTWQPLPSSIQNPVWAPKGYQVAYFVTGGDATILTTLDLGAAKPAAQTLLRISAQDLNLSWATSSRIFIFDRPSALVPGSAWLFDIKNKALSPVAEDQRGLLASWNENGSQALVFQSGSNGRGGDLSLRDSQGRILQRFNVFTLPTKCAFGVQTVRFTTSTKKMAVSTSTKSTSTASTATSTATSTTIIVAQNPVLFCGIPRDSGQVAGKTLPDDYLKRAVFTEDDVYQINLADGEIKVLLDDRGISVDVENVKAFNNKLYFVSRLDGRLYVVPL